MSNSGKPQPTGVGNPEVSSVELAWLAGIIDGEGCLCAQRYITKRMLCRKVKVHVSVTNTDWNLIKRVKQLFNRICGAHYAAHVQPPKGRFPSSHICWRVTVTARREVVALLSAILPHLIAKRERAQLGLRLTNLMLDLPYGARPPQEVERCADRIKFLNHNPSNPHQPETVETVRHAPEGEETVQAVSNDGLTCS